MPSPRTGSPALPPPADAFSPLVLCALPAAVGSGARLLLRAAELGRRRRRRAMDEALSAVQVRRPFSSSPCRSPPLSSLLSPSRVALDAVSPMLLCLSACALQPNLQCLLRHTGLSPGPFFLKGHPAPQCPSVLVVFFVRSPAACWRATPHAGEGGVLKGKQCGGVSMPMEGSGEAEAGFSPRFSLLLLPLPSSSLYKRSVWPLGRRMCCALCLDRVAAALRCVRSSPTTRVERGRRRAAMPPPFSTSSALQHSPPAASLARLYSEAPSAYNCQRAEEGAGRSEERKKERKKKKTRPAPCPRPASM